MADPVWPGSPVAPAAPPAAAPEQAWPGLSLADLDRRSGAPANVRAAVGAAQTDADRLATLRRFAPDARPFENGNFIYTDRRTGRPTVYNPSGFQLADVASVLPEVGEFLGGVVGGAAALPAAVAGAPVTAGASTLAVPAGVGLGAAAGRELATLGANWFGDTVDTRGPGERVVDAATTAGINAVGVPIGNALARVAGQAFAPVRRFLSPGTGQAALDDFAAAGVAPSAGAVTGNRTVQLAEQGLGSTPGGAAPIQELAERQASQIRDEARRIGAGYGTATTPAEAGGALRTGAQNAVARFEARQAALYDDAFSRIPGDARAALPNVQRLGDDLEAALALAPQSRAATLGPVIDRVRAALGDATGDGVPFEALRAIRTDLGRIIGSPPNAASAPGSDTIQYMRQLYGALSDDMTAAARAASPEAAERLAVADRYTRLNRNVNLPALERVLDQGTDEQVFRLAFPQNGRPDAQAMARLRRNMEPQEWNALASAVIDRMGIPTPGQRRALDDFSVSTFLTNWNRLISNGDGARNVLFGGNRQTAELATDLDRLVRIAGRLRDVDRMANPSGTARNYIAGAGLLEVGQRVMRGDLMGAVGVAALGTLVPRQAAQLITNPQFVRWLADATPELARTGVLADRPLLRLAQVAEANPDLRDAISAYQRAFNPANQIRLQTGTPATGQTAPALPR